MLFSFLIAEELNIDKFAKTRGSVSDQTRTCICCTWNGS